MKRDRAMRNSKTQSSALIVSDRDRIYTVERFKNSLKRPFRHTGPMIAHGN